MKDKRRQTIARTVEDDKFIELPLTAQALYFHYVAREINGYVKNPISIQRMICATEEDLKLLIENGFVMDLGYGLTITNLVNIKENCDNDK